MNDPAKGVPKTLGITSTAFGPGQPIPARYTCQGPDVSPPLAFGGIPSQAKALALIMDDPDAPRGTWTHWTFWNLPPRVTTLPEQADLAKEGAREGRTDSGPPGYAGPCPPLGTHRYFFRLYALDAALDPPAGANRQELARAMTNHVIAWGELMGTYAQA